MTHLVRPKQVFHRIRTLGKLFYPKKCICVQAEATIQPGGPQQGRNGNSQSPFRGDTRQAAIDPSGLPPRMQGLAYATAAKPAIQSSAVSSAEALAFWSGLGSSQPGEKQPMSGE